MQTCVYVVNNESNLGKNILRGIRWHNEKGSPVKPDIQEQIGL